MAILSIPVLDKEIRDPQQIRQFCNERNIFFDQWVCEVDFCEDASQEEILEAYSADLKPFMENGGYQTADVISLNHSTPNYPDIRKIFLSEHIHTEDEIRFFVDGQGLFWFNLENGEPIFNILCERGDLISVPHGTKHWFDAGAKDPFVKAIRIFTEKSGWTPHYTNSGVDLNYKSFMVPDHKQVKFILTDIEGTTTSISFVKDTLFPHFLNHADQLLTMKDDEGVAESLEELRNICRNNGINAQKDEDLIEILKEWCRNDQKITVLKSLQGIIWKKAYESGQLKGHIYEDVPEILKKWQTEGIRMGVFSSGSVAAQKLIYGHSEAGDLTPFFSAYFDTNTGSKKDAATYIKIASLLNIEPGHILFLSDDVDELIAANKSGFQTIQLLREGLEPAWKRSAYNFKDIIFN